MKITTTPVCRVGSQGQTLRYIVKAEGATQVLVPENGVKGVQVRVTDTRQTGDGVEAQLQVKVLDSTLL
jgi:hypothetical protein